MKILSRDFTTKEKVLIGILLVIILAFLYYQFVDQPITNAIEKANNEKANNEIELESVNIKIAQLEKMKKEIDRIKAEGTISPMPSYNNSKAVNDLLNDVIGDYSYSITFANLTRDGNLVRREFSLEFAPPDFSAMVEVLTALEKSEFRCLIDGIDFTRIRYMNAERNGYAYNYQAKTTATFYETMVGGTPDSGLPEVKPEG
ncbi:MAG: hypothetical protein IJV00_01645 [Clostridia bacterium]|nr:hypothetical protein [Clostridia bacterium]